MPISKAEAKQLLERLVFDESHAKEWVQDVWDLSPTLGDSAARLIEVFESLIDYCPEERLEHLLQGFYQDQL